MTQDLIKGVQDFKHHYYTEDNEHMAELIESGQDPKYFVISCIDSRCNPGYYLPRQTRDFFCT